MIRIFVAIADVIVERVIYLSNGSIVSVFIIQKDLGEKNWKRIGINWEKGKIRKRVYQNYEIEGKIFWIEKVRTIEKILL